MTEFNQIGRDKINEIRGVTDENRVARLKYYFQESKKIAEVTQEIINFVKLKKKLTTYYRILWNEMKDYLLWKL